MRVIAFYGFFDLKEIEETKIKINKFFKDIEIKGIIIIAHEGLNGTIAVPKTDEIKTISFLEELGVKKDYIKISNFDGKRVFKSFKIKVKKEIVTSDFDLTIDDINKGQFIDPHSWEEFISQDNVVIVDTRNDYEFKIGHFNNAINPGIKTFKEFKNYLDSNKKKLEGKKVAVYCTGGIRCEKAGPLMQKHGIDAYQLKGGILKYFEKTLGSFWNGECFVFDYRVSVNKDLKPGSSQLCYGCNIPLTEVERQSPHYEVGFKCPNCYEQLTDKRKRSLSDKREHWRRIL